MDIRWFGAILIVVGCSGVGFTMAAGARQEERQLLKLMGILTFMETELQYRLTALPELCAMAAREVGGTVGRVFCELSGALMRQEQPDVGECMQEVLKKKEEFSRRIRRHLLQLGRSLGRYELTGQLKSLQTVRCGCERDLQEIRKNRDVRLRSYQTLGLCAGTALVILFA